MDARQDGKTRRQDGGGYQGKTSKATRRQGHDASKVTRSSKASKIKQGKTTSKQGDKIKQGKATRPRR